MKKNSSYYGVIQRIHQPITARFVVNGTRMDKVMVIGYHIAH